MGNDQPDKLTGPPVADGQALRHPVAKWAFLIPRLVFKLWFGSVFGVSMLLLYLPFKVLLRKEAGYPAAFRLMRAWAAFLGVAGMMPLRVKGRENLPEPPYIVCFNHSSYLDIIHAFNALPHYFLFMGKRELLTWPLFRIFFKGMHIAVDRDNGMEAARALAKAGRALDEGAAICIFPEGTIPRSAPRMLPFKDGAFRLAIRKQVPVVPVAFLNNWRLLGDPEVLSSRGRPGLARAVIHAPIDTKGMTPDQVGELSDRVFGIIATSLQQKYPAK